MKKLFSLISLITIFSVQNVHAEFIVYEEDEGTTPFVDYQIWETNSLNLTSPATTFDYRIKNTGTTPIDIRIHVDSVINSDNSSLNAEFCYNGICTAPVLQGYLYPLPNENITIQPGQLQPFASLAKFANKTEGVDPTKPVDFVFKFYEVDAQGNEIGTPLHIRCRYRNLNPTSSLSENTLSTQIQIYPNPVIDTFTLKVNTTSKKSNILITNINGQIVKNIALNTTNSYNINVSDLTTGLYFVQLIYDNRILGVRKFNKL